MRKPPEHQSLTDAGWQHEKNGSYVVDDYRVRIRYQGSHWVLTERGSDAGHVSLPGQSLRAFLLSTARMFGASASLKMQALEWALISHLPAR